jgi:hypothetical protein
MTQEWHNMTKPACIYITLYDISIYIRVWMYECYVCYVMFCFVL